MTDAELPARGRPLLRRGALASRRPVGATSPRARTSAPDKVALVLDDRARHLRRAAPRRRRAVGPARRAGSVQPGDVVILLGRHSIEAAVAMLGCLHRGVVLAPLPPMFNVDPARRRSRGRRGARGDRRLRRRARRSRSAREAAPRSSSLIALLPTTLRRADRRGRAGRRARARDADDIADGPALLRHDLGAEGHRALEQHAALRDRGRLPALGAHAATTSTSWSREFGFVGGMVFGYLPVLLTAAPAC